VREFARTFFAMSTDVTAIVVADRRRAAAARQALEGVESLFREVEARLTRFRPDSELARLNESPETSFSASAVLFSVVEAAVGAARSTDGLFDPTILGALIRAGYDRSFELIPAQTPATRSPMPAFNRRRAWQDVRLDPSRGTITLPRGCGLDLGGIGKGWTIDRAAEILSSFDGFAVDAGGDMRLGGTQADGSPWTVGVQDPFAHDRDLLTLAISNRAVATSSTMRRRWQMDGQPQHHLIDPRTGLPAETSVVAATVLANSATLAEVCAKVALLLGPAEGLAFLERETDVEGMLVIEHAGILPSSGLAEVVGAA